MNRMFRTSLLGPTLSRAICMGIVSILGISAASADTREEFWPELDAFFKLDERTRLFLVTSATRGEDTDNSTGEMRFLTGQIGAHLDVTLQPIFRFSPKDEDWERNRYLWMRIGYRYVSELDDSGGNENRGILELNTRGPLPDNFWLTGRLRWEARDVDGQYSNRYGVRLGAERSYAPAGRTLVPYARVEFLYDTRFDTWNRQRYQVGVDIAINDRWRVEPYFARQDDNRSEPAHLNVLGLILKYSR